MIKHRKEHQKEYDAKRYAAKKQERYFRTTAKYIKVRSEALERDNHKCTVCSETEDLHVHHIIPVSKDFSLAYDKDNLITLCSLHHKEIHRK